MGIFSVQFLSGDYRERQRAANAAGCVAYVEHHFNSTDLPAAGSYAVAIVGSNGSATSGAWGRWYAKAVAAEFGIGVGGDGGIAVGGFGGRGDFNLRYTAMPAILLEPLFASNPEHAAWIRSEEGQTRLAKVLVESIRVFFPSGGLVAFSIGHKGKTSKPNDRGCSVVGGGTEAEYAEAVLLKAQDLLVALQPDRVQNAVRVVEGGATLFERGIAAGAVVSWDPATGTLRIGT